MITSEENGFTVIFELIRATLLMEIFQADQAFRPLPAQIVVPVNTETTSTVTFTDSRLKAGFKYFVRFFTESGGLFSGETEFFEFTPVVEVSNILLEDDFNTLLEDDFNLLTEDA